MGSTGAFGFGSFFRGAKKVEPSAIDPQGNASAIYKVLLNYPFDVFTIVVLEDTLGYTWIWEQVGQGVYRGKPSIALDPARTALQITGTGVGIMCTALVDFEDIPGSIVIGIYSPAGGAGVDGQLLNTTLTIQTYL